MSIPPPSRASTSPQPAVLWDPYTTLALERDHRCIGEAKSKQRKCHAHIAYANANDMQKLLRKLSTRQPDPDVVEPLLARIAGYGLCRNTQRKHQEQSATIVQQWKDQIREAYPGRAVVAENTADQEHETQAPTTGNPASTRASPAVDVDELALLRLVRQALEGLDGSTRDNSRENTGDVSETPVPTTEIPDEANDEAAAVTPTPEPTHDHSPHPHAHHTVVCPDTFTTHVPRREPDLECPICKEAFENGSEMTWCKGGCGRSMHAECVELWRESRMEEWFAEDDMEQDLVFTCALCRTEWVDCECEE